MKKAALVWSAGLAIAAALAVGVVLAGFSCGSATRAEPPHAWVAFAFPHTANPAPIRVFDAVNPGKERRLGSPGQYAAPKWSPDARQLGALQWIDEDGPVRFLLFDRKSGRELVLPMPGLPCDYAWSPDSSRVAAVATDGVVVVFDREGRELGRLAVPPKPEGRDCSGLSTWNWSPDSRYFRAQPNNRLVVMDREGDGVVYEPRDFPAGVYPPGVQVFRWASPTELLVVTHEPAHTPQSREWVVTVGPGSLTWTPRPIPPEDSAPASVLRLWEDVRAHFGNAVQTQLTADGTAIVVEDQDRQRSRDMPRFVLLHDGRETPIDLGPEAEAHPVSLLRWLAIVITGASAP